MARSKAIAIRTPINAAQQGGKGLAIVQAMKVKNLSKYEKKKLRKQLKQVTGTVIRNPHRRRVPFQFAPVATKKRSVGR